jgi:hypothetical protein
MKRELWNRCDDCGRFIAYKSFAYMRRGGKAVRKLIHPDNHFSGEKWETRCAKCVRRNP